MKRVLCFLLCLLGLFLISCNEPEKEKEEIDYLLFINEAMKDLEFPSETKDNITFPESINYCGYDILLSWETDNDAISNSGVVTRGEEDIDVYLTVTAVLETETVTKKLDNPIKVIAKEPVVEPVDYQEIIDNALATLVLNENNDEVEFVKSISYEGININLNWSLKENISDDFASIDFSNNKISSPLDDDVIVTIICKGTYENTTSSKEFTYKLISLKSKLIAVSENLNLPETTYVDITLPKQVGDVMLDWYSYDYETITKNGQVSFVKENTNVHLSCGFSITYYVDGQADDYFYDADYYVLVVPSPFEERERKALISLNVPEEIYSSITLPTEFDKEIYATWASSNPSVLTNTGEVIRPKEDTLVTLELTFTDGVDSNNTTKYQFVVKVMSSDGDEDEAHFEYHNIIDRVENYSKSHFTNIKYNDDGKIVLADNATTGTYESKVFYTKQFDEAVGSWSCITSKTATCELEISVYANGKWSKYFTYGVWGLGKTNTYYNQTDTYAKMSVDEILVTTGVATAIKYRITLSRNSASNDSPVLSLVCLALDICEPGYKYNVDISNLPKEVVNECPKLYQYDVPGIGGSICSATTTTMLLKWKGHSFKNQGYTYEHEFIANMVADPGHNSPTYGNWSYNMAVAGAYGEDAYVARMFSINEVIYHLATVGPMGASIKSSNGEWGYKTNGHLIVVIGYKMDNSGNITKIICNDPAVSSVYYEVTLSQFNTCWRNIAYVLE